MCVEAQCTRSEEQSTPLGEFLPSVKLVYKTIEYEGPLTQKELVEATRLSARTVRSAVSKLEGNGYVEERLYLPDARQQLYVLAGED